jgi:hypothetical protein
MIFNNLQRFNNTLTLMSILFNKKQGTGLTASVIASVLSGQIDAKTVNMKAKEGRLRRDLLLATCHMHKPDA